MGPCSLQCRARALSAPAAGHGRMPPLRTLEGPPPPRASNATQGVPPHAIARLAGRSCAPRWGGRAALTPGRARSVPPEPPPLYREEVDVRCMQDGRRRQIDKNERGGAAASG
jgi:hypothetical protein